MTYEFKCVPCGITFERTENNKTFCPSCKKVAKRVYSLAGIRFVGTGFYKSEKKSD